MRSRMYREVPVWGLQCYLCGEPNFLFSIFIILLSLVLSVSFVLTAAPDGFEKLFSWPERFYFYILYDKRVSGSTRPDNLVTISFTN